MTQDSKRIVILTDATHYSDSAIDTGLRLCRQFGMTPHFLHVVQPMREPYFSVIEPVRKQAVEQHFEQLVERAKTLGCESHTVAMDGRPFAETILYAHDIAATAVVVSPDAYLMTEGARIRHGVCARKIARKNDRPTLLVKHSVASYDRALAMVDFSEYSRAGCQALVSVLPEHASIDLLHCFELPPIIAAGEIAAVPEIDFASLNESAHEKASEEFETFLAGIDFGGRTVRTHIQSGMPVEVALTHIQEHQIDIAAIGTHGRNALMSVMMGSVAEGLVDLAPCDLMIAPPPGRIFKPS